MDEVVDLGIDNIDDVEILGHGGFSVVYSATHSIVGRPVAVKVLTKLIKESDRRRFELECRAMGRLSSHPNVVQVYDAGFTPDGRPYLVMELVDGGSLADLLARHGPVPWRTAISYMLGVCDALGQAHRYKIIHRDVKPENILLADGVPKLTDFGIARVQDGGLESSTHITASWLHTPPETLERRRDERSDLYSLASTLYTLVAGHAPFWRDGEDSITPLMFRLASEDAPPLPADVTPPALSNFLVQALAKSPADRPQSATEWAATLRQLKAGSEWSPTSSPAPQQAKSAPRAASPKVAPTPAATHEVDSGDGSLRRSGRTGRSRRRTWVPIAAAIVAVLTASTAGLYARSLQNSDPDDAGLGVSTTPEGTPPTTIVEDDAAGTTVILIGDETGPTFVPLDEIAQDEVVMLRGLSVMPTTPEPGQPIRISLEISNAARIEFVTFQRPSGLFDHPTLGPYEIDGDRYDTELPLTESAATGRWRIAHIQVSDDVGNIYEFFNRNAYPISQLPVAFDVSCSEGFALAGYHQCVSPVMSANGVFDVGGTNQEIDPPELRLIDIPSTIRTNDEVEIVLDAPRVRGIQFIFLRMEDPQAPSVVLENFMVSVDGDTITATTRLLDGYPPGEYYVGTIGVENAIEERYQFESERFVFSQFSSVCPSFVSNTRTWSCYSDLLTGLTVEITG